MLCLLPLAAQGQQADPAGWGVYAHLPGKRLSTDNVPGGGACSWAWEGANSLLAEDCGDAGGRSQIASLRGGKLARLVAGRHTWTGAVQVDGSVVWEPEGDFLTRVAADPYRVRLDGDVLVLEYVHLKDGQVAGAWPMRRLTAAEAPRSAASAVSIDAPVVTPLAPEAAGTAPATQAPAAAGSDEPAAGPRALSEADLARLRASMARDKQWRADTLRRQQEEARQQAEAQRRAAEQQEEEEDDDDGFATALMSGLAVFQGEMTKYQAQQAQQQAFVANLQRQQAEARRQREAEQQRQAAVQMQAQRQQQMASAQQSTAQQQQLQQQQLQRQQAAAREAAARAEAERQLRERAAAERLRQQQVREPQQTEAGLGSMLVAGAAQGGGPASTLDDPRRCVSQPSQVPNPNCKDGSAFTIHNSCAQTVEMRLCIKTRQGSWDCGRSQGIPPGGSWGYPSCSGTSTTFLDVRSAGSGRGFAEPPL